MNALVIGNVRIVLATQNVCLMNRGVVKQPKTMWEEMAWILSSAPTKSDNRRHKKLTNGTAPTKKALLSLCHTATTGACTPVYTCTQAPVARSTPGVRTRVVHMKYIHDDMHVCMDMYIH